MKKTGKKLIERNIFGGILLRQVIHHLRKQTVSERSYLKWLGYLSKLFVYASRFKNKVIKCNCISWKQYTMKSINNNSKNNNITVIIFYSTNNSYISSSASAFTELRFPQNWLELTWQLMEIMEKVWPSVPQFLWTRCF